MYLVSTGLGAIGILFVDGYTNIIILLCFFLSNGSCVSVVNAIVVDLYPTQYRAMAMALTLAIGRCGAVAGSHIVGYLLEVQCDIGFYLGSSVHIGNNSNATNTSSCTNKILFLALFFLSLMIPVPLFVKRRKKSTS